LTLPKKIDNYFSKTFIVQKHITFLSRRMERFHWFVKKAGIQYKQHQYDGVQWCLRNELSKNKVRGGIIADEMGLGKTITAIGLMLTNFMTKTLIVLPNVLIAQWVSEIQRTTGHKPLVFYGAEKKMITLEQLSSAPIVITSYSHISVSAVSLNKLVDDPPKSMLHMVQWNRVIFDEAHHLRNKNARYWGAKVLVSPIKWLITGTPVQNKRRDFYNLCSVVGLPSSYYTDPDNLEELLNAYVLRRTKSQAGIKLPKVELGCNTVDWATEDERVLSEDIHNAIRLADSVERLKLIIKARQTCILPALLKNSLTDLVDDNIIPKSESHVGALASSSKLDAVLDTLLSRRENGNGKLIFCHFREEIDMIVSRLKESGITSLATFDGRTSLNKRAGILREKVEFLVLQIQTGCEGLNLQRDFSEVYFVSPNWNPAIEEQAIARCHRIGQIKPVHVFRFQMTTYQKLEPLVEEDVSPSLDQYIQNVQSVKREIIEDLLF
jgi:SNF2 family DNA or RNA helicase